jgi:thiol-disulfide isomerase/thioredoxin
MLPGRLHEGRGDATPREMAATGGSPPGQNPAYRPAPPLLLTALARNRSGLPKIDRLAGVRLRPLTILTSALVLLAGCSSRPDDLRFARASGSMPVISRLTLTGGRVGPSDYAGKVVVVNFWNQDCPPCRSEMPLLQREFRRLRDRGVALIGIVYVGGNWPNDPGAATRFLQRLGISYPNVLDDASELAGKFNITGIPTTIVVDRSGQMKFRRLGRIRSGEVDELLSRLDRGAD